jgi:hypothetical protein
VSSIAILYTLGLLLAYLCSEGRDRHVWGILLAFSMLRAALNTVLFDHIDAYGEHIWFATREWIVIMVLLRFTPSRLGVFQSLCLGVAWIVNFALYFDLVVGTNVVYDHYESYILGIDLMQLFPASYGITQAIRKLYRKALGSLHVRSSGRGNCLASEGFLIQTKETKKTEG